MVYKKLTATWGNENVIIKGATNISFSRAIDYKGDCSFEIPNHYGAAHDTWVNREDTRIRIWEDLDDGGTTLDILRFSGVVTTIDAGRPLKITGKGWMDKTSWVPVTETDSKFIIDEGVISLAPAGVEEFFKCHDSEGEDPEIENLAYDGDYIIISDSTQGTSNVDNIVSHSGAPDEEGDTHWTIEDGIVSDTQLDDGNHWELKLWEDAGRPDGWASWENQIWIKLDTEAENLNSAWKIHQIDITVDMWLKAHHANLTDGAKVYMVTALCYGQAYSVWAPLRILSTDWVRLKFVEDIVHISRKYTVTSATDLNAYFNPAGDEHNGPYLVFYLMVPVGGDLISEWNDVTVEINHVKMDLKYETSTFDIINMEIIETIDADGHTEFNVGEDISEKGVAAGDKWQVVESADDVYKTLARVMGVGFTVNKGDPINSGVGTDYFGINAYDLGLAVNRQFSYIYYDYLRDGDEELFIHKFSDADATGFIYGPSNNKPSGNYNVGIESQVYSAVMVYYKNGMVGPIFPETPNTAYTQYKVKVLIRKDILTMGKAVSVGDDWIKENNVKMWSFHLHWAYPPTDTPIIGQTHTIWDEYGHEFTGMVCRRLSMAQDGALGRWAIDAYFGQGSTPPLEGLGTDIRRIKHDITLNETQLLTSSSVSSNRHSTLLGVTSGQHHVKTVKYTNGEAVTAMGAEGDGNPLNHDKWTTGDTEGVIDTEIVGGESIDNAIDSLIGTHKDDEDAHHLAPEDINYSDNWSSYDTSAISGKQLYTKIHSIDDNIEGLRVVQHLKGTWEPAAVNSSYKERRGEQIPGVITWGTSGSPDLSDWTADNDANTTTTIEALIGTHTDVLELDDQNAAGECDIYLPFTHTIVSGDMIDFYVKSTDTALGYNIFITSASAQIIVYLRLVADKLDAFYDGGWNNITDIADNTDYHISLLFGSDAFTISINGTSYGPFDTWVAQSNATRIKLGTYNANSGYQCYFDSLGFSWEGYTQFSNYFIALDYPASPNIGDYYIIDTETEISGIQFKKWDWIVWNGLRWIHITTLQQELTVRVRPGESIQFVIDTVLAAGGGTVMLMEGTHDLAGTSIEIDDGGANRTLRIIGMGKASIVDIGGDVVAFDISGEQIGSLLLKDFAIDANDLNTTIRAVININELNENPITIDNITIYGDGVNGRGVYVDSQNIIIKNCRITNLTIGIVVDAGDGSYVNIHDNWIQGMASKGIRINNLSDYPTIKDNHIEDCGIGIDCEGKYFLMEGNRIINTTTAVYVDEDGHGSIVDNIIYDFVEYGIYIDCDHVTITSNNIEYGHDAANTYGIYLHDNTDLCTVVANVITNIITATAGTGIRVKNAANTNDIAGNLISNVDFEYSGQPTTTLRDVKGLTKFLSRTVFDGGLTVNSYMTLNGNYISGCGNINPNSDNNYNCGHADAYWNTVYTHNLTGASAKVPPLDIGLDDLCKIDFTEQDVEKLKAQFPDYIKGETILDKKPVITLSVFDEIRLSQKCIKELKGIIDDLQKRLSLLEKT